MRQSDNTQAFFDKYGFKMNMEKPHPRHKDTMHFEGLEADYVTDLECQIRDLEKYVECQSQKINWLVDRATQLWKKESSEK